MIITRIFKSLEMEVPRYKFGQESLTYSQFSDHGQAYNVYYLILLGYYRVKNSRIRYIAPC
jgi:hypothetical protein